MIESLPMPEPEPEPSNILHLVPNARSGDTLLRSHEQLASSETAEAIVDRVKDLTKLEAGEKDKSLFTRRKILTNADGNRVIVNEHDLLNNSNNRIVKFHEEHLKSKVVSIEIQPHDASKEEIFSVTREGDSDDCEYVLNTHTYYTDTDPKTNTVVEKELVRPASETDATTLLAYLEMLQNRDRVIALLAYVGMLQKAIKNRPGILRAPDLM